MWATPWATWSPKSCLSTSPWCIAVLVQGRSGYHDCPIPSLLPQTIPEVSLTWRYDDREQTKTWVFLYPDKLRGHVSCVVVCVLRPCTCRQMPFETNWLACRHTGPCGCLVPCRIGCVNTHGPYKEPVLPLEIKRFWTWFVDTSNTYKFKNKQKITYLLIYG